MASSVLDASDKLQAIKRRRPVPEEPFAPLIRPSADDGKPVQVNVKGWTFEAQEGAIKNMLAENAQFRSMWQNGMLVMYTVLVALSSYLLVAQATSPYAEDAAYFMPLRDKVSTADIMLPLLMLVLASCTSAAGLWFENTGVTMMSLLPGIVPSLQWTYVCVQAELWGQWQYLWIPTIYPLLLGGQFYVSWMFADMAKDIVALRETLKTDPNALAARNGLQKS